MKKGQSISINTIIIAAIALVVMILVIMIFTKNMFKFRVGSNSCESNGGTCIKTEDITETCSGEYKSVNKNFPCYKPNGDVDETKVCCIKT